jgi:glucokinase
VVRLAVNLGWEEVPAGPRLGEALGVPCYAENDVRAATLAVARRYAGTPGENLAYLCVGTGIAAGLFVHGALYTGARGMAGEIGHTIVAPGGPVCGCGARGCLETVAAGPGIARMAQRIARAGLAPQLQPEGPLTALDVYHAASAGDQAAQAVVDGAGRYLARAIHALVMAYDIERVVVGGGMARAGTAFMEPIERELEDLRRQSPLAREMLPPGRVVLLPPDFDAGTWGALALAEQGLSMAQADGSPSVLPTPPGWPRDKKGPGIKQLTSAPRAEPSPTPEAI